MKNEISKRDFDSLIVGCGAYRPSLAAFAQLLKNMFIHLRGGIQFLS